MKDSVSVDSGVVYSIGGIPYVVYLSSASFSASDSFAISVAFSVSAIFAVSAAFSCSMRALSIISKESVLLSRLPLTAVIFIVPSLLVCNVNCEGLSESVVISASEGVSTLYVTADIVEYDG